MNVLVATADGTFAVDLDSEELEPAEPFEPVPPPALNLPRVVAHAHPHALPWGGASLPSFLAAVGLAAILAVRDRTARQSGA